jgi:catechol 2,3-dioxygenase-like lactoylglutathione lyase family enzyme
MKIFITSVFVDDQAKALKFYTGVLGFVKKSDITANNYRWLTVVSPEGPADMELHLELNGNPAAKTYQKAIRDAGIPANIFRVGDIHSEYERMKNLGVTFVTPPARTGPATSAVFDDTCGNLITIVQPAG